MYRGRTKVLLALFTIILLVCVGRFFQLQIIEGNQLKELREQNINDFDFLMKDFIQNNDYIMIKGSNASGVNKISRSFILGNKNAL